MSELERFSKDDLQTIRQAKLALDYGQAIGRRAGLLLSRYINALESQTAFKLRAMVRRNLANDENAEPNSANTPPETAERFLANVARCSNLTCSVCYPRPNTERPRERELLVADALVIMNGEYGTTQTLKNFARRVYTLLRESA